MDLTKAIVELYRKASSELPDDVVAALKKVHEKGLASDILKIILKNTSLAKEKKLPICQDSGIPVFYVNYHDGKQKDFVKAIYDGTKIATSKNYLRPNAVDPITGENVGNVPLLYFHHWDKDFLQIDLILKGGGSENVGAVYSLPDLSLNASRDIAGIKKCVIDAMFKAQGNGCSPNILGVGIGGSKSSAMALAKKQLLRKLDEVNDDEVLAKMENELYSDLNKLGIGPMGLGGNTTVLGVKIGKQLRHPASFFVAISFMCWACRRQSLIIK